MFLFLGICSRVTEEFLLECQICSEIVNCLVNPFGVFLPFQQFHTWFPCLFWVCLAGRMVVSGVMLFSCPTGTFWSLHDEEAENSSVV